MPLADFKTKYSTKELRSSSSIASEKREFMRKYYPSIRHDPHEGYFYGFLCLIYDGVNKIEDLKKQMRLFFFSATKQVVVEEQDVEEYLQYARKKKLIIEDPDGSIYLTENGKKLVELSYYSTLHASYWMNLLFNEKVLLLTTAIFLIILSCMKILVGMQLASQGMIYEGFENLTDLIKVAIIFLVGLKLKKDELNPALRERLENLLNSEHQEINFNIEIQNEILDTVLKSKKENFKDQNYVVRKKDGNKDKL